MKFSRCLQDGFSLVEVTLALALAAFGLVAVVGLIPTGLQQVKQSSAESVAVNILSKLVSDVRNSPTSGTNAAIPIRSATTGKAYFDVNGRFLGTSGATPDSIYAVSWQVREKNSTTGVPANVHLAVCWPAVSSTPTGLAEAVVPLDSGTPSLP